MKPSMENWVFLGDSLVEGVGSSRVSFVNEIVEQLRERPTEGEHNCHKSVTYIRFREVTPTVFDPLIKTNMAGYYDTEKNNIGPTLIVWNLASEGTTVDNDIKWLPLLKVIRPDRIIIFRGSLENILRPRNISTGQWPWWVPRSWRRAVAVDPRCYFSNTWWRKGKQMFLDYLKQLVRHYLINKYGKAPLIKQNDFNNYYKALVSNLVQLDAKIAICGLLPVDNKTFPSSDSYFLKINQDLKELSNLIGAQYIDWGSSLDLQSKMTDLYYRDGFHPNKNGAIYLAKYLLDSLGDTIE